MTRQNRFLFSIFSILFFAVPSIGFSQAELQKSSDDILLEEKLAADTSVPEVKEDLSPLSITQPITELRVFNHITRTKTPKCADAQKSIFNDKYVLTTDKEGQPCRIYDLSFPNLKAMFASKKAIQVPVQRMFARDYLNWLDGNLNAVEQSTDRFKKTFSPIAAARSSWVSKLKFKKTPVAVPGSKIFPGDVGLPQSFALSDLDLGGEFQFDANTRAEIQNLIAEVSDSDVLSTDNYTKILAHPQSLLESVRFNWNDLEKVYDVILEGGFLPIGPVALVEYQTQYKYAVEKMFRSLLSAGLKQLARSIPTPMISSAVEVLVMDAFEQLDMAYEYQMLQLEDSLKSIDMAISNRALNVLYGQRADLFTAYVQAAAQGKAFDWQAAEKLGKAARYASEKGRDVMMSKMNSSLVLNKKCQNEFVHGYFANCSINGKISGLYSLISEQKISSKSFGAAMIYNYNKPYETSLRRGGAWLLSIAVRVVGLPISRNLALKLDTMLKGYMKAGILDEALLKNNLSTQLNGSEISKWLYIQNLNVFLPKTVNMENNMITANKKLLGVSIQ